MTGKAVLFLPNTTGRKKPAGCVCYHAIDKLPKIFYVLQSWMLSGKLDLNSEIRCLDSSVLWSRRLQIMWQIHLNWIMEVFMTKYKMNNIACNIVLVLFILILNVILCCSYNFCMECAYYFEFIRAQVHHWCGNTRFGRTCVGCWGSGDWWCEVWHYNTNRPFLLNQSAMKQLKM